MPSISDMVAGQPAGARPKFIKGLCIGEQGSGKTGGLAALADAGYRVRVLDTDAKIAILGGLFQPPGTNLQPGQKASPYKWESHKNLSYVTVTEKYKILGAKAIPVEAKAWDRCLSLLTNWIDGDDKPGNCAKWGEKSVLVIDTLTSISNYAMNVHLAMNARLQGPIYLADWGVAQGMVNGLLDLLTSDEVQTHVLINCHVTYMGGEFANKDTNPGMAMLPAQGYPRSLGKALSQVLGGKFNTTLEFGTEGYGVAAKQKIFTKTRGLIKLTSIAPLAAKASYPLETGLADYFFDALGSKP